MGNQHADTCAYNVSLGLGLGVPWAHPCLLLAHCKTRTDSIVPECRGSSPHLAQQQVLTIVSIPAQALGAVRRGSACPELRGTSSPMRGINALVLDVCEQRRRTHSR